MPPRKRNTPEPEPEAPTLEAAEAASAEAPETADGTAAGSNEKPRASAKPKSGLCPGCFPAGWPDGATSAGCAHGSWQRTL